MRLFVIGCPEGVSRSSTAKAVRDAARVVDGPGSDAQTALALVDAGVPIYVGDFTLDEVADVVVGLLEDSGFEVQTFADGEGPDIDLAEAVADETPEGPDEFFASVPVAQTALAFMAFADGSPSVAMSYLATMGLIDADGPFHEAAVLLLETFPATESQVAVARAIVAQSMSDDEQTP